MSNDDIKVLNKLTERLIDSADGYEQAADATDRADLKTQFKELAVERRQMAAKFREKVRSLGGDPEDDGSLLAAAHRTFLSIRASIQDDAKAAVTEVERGEDTLTNDFENAIADEDISMDTRAFIRQHWHAPERDHARVERLKQAMAA